MITKMPSFKPGHDKVVVKVKPQPTTTVSPEKAHKLVKSMQFFYICADLIKFEYQFELVDARFKNPAINQHAKRIRESATAIQTHISSVLKPKNGTDQEATEDKIGELWRVMEFFVNMTTQEIKDFMDGVGDIKKAIAKGEICDIP